MHSLIQWKLISLVIIIFLSCGPSEQERRTRAQNDLAARNIEYSNVNFIRAVESGDSALAALFIEAGIYPDLITRAGVTPLMIAAAHGHVPVARLLIATGADVNAEQQNGATVLNVVLMGEQAVNSQANTAYLQQDIKNRIARKTELIELLINSGAEVIPDSYTLLLQGIKTAVEPGGNTRILQMILNAGADVNQRPVWGKSTLMIGVESMLYRPNLEVVRLLLEKGANINDRYIDPRDPARPISALSITRAKEFRDSVGENLADQLIKLLQEADTKIQ